MAQNIVPTGVERFFGDDEVIVSKTNLKGHMTYTNRLFMEIAGYEEHELLGQPHSLIRHPDMPRCVFKFLWDTIEQKREIFAYVVNMCKNGDHYWVLAHVTPSLNASGEIVGYHSNRRVPGRDVLDQTIIPLYKQLLAEEEKHKNRKDGMNSAYQMLQDIIQEKGIGYDELIFALQN
ncbi:MAG: PAS domain-containing protein [Alcanivorax sp.]